MLPGDARTSCTLTCSNRYPAIQSSYRWHGKLEHEEEHPLLLKTRAALAQQAEDAIRTLPPYAVPPIARMRPDGASQDYINWVYSVTRAV